MEPKFVIMNKKFLLVGLFVVIAIVAAAILIPSFKPKRPELPPEEMVHKALANTKAENSFRYSTESRLTVKGNKELLSKIEGEKSGSKGIHIKGEMMKSKIELYQLDDTTYTKDSFSNRWVVLKGNTLEQQQLFMTELNPLANFDYNNILDIKYEGLQKVNGAQTWVYSFHPQTVSPFIEMFWTNVVYKVWVDCDKIVIRKACLTAESKKDHRDTLVLNVSLTDFGDKIELKTPKAKELGQP